MAAKKLVTFYLDKGIYEKFKRYCEKEGLIISKKVERLIEEEIK